MKDIKNFKSHLEFLTLDMDDGWEVPPGYPNGIEQKIISGTLDEVHKCGIRTRFLRFESGAYSSEAFVHEYWEEVLLITTAFISITLVGEIISERLHRQLQSSIKHINI